MKYSTLLQNESGFALPSILFVITILSLIAASVLSLKYFQQRIALTDIAKIKAEYAAESGVARAAARLHSQENLAQAFRGNTDKFSFDDGSGSEVTLKAWGAYLLISSEGRFQKITSKRVALAADHPSKMFDDALYLANSSHQLVFAGTSEIIGDVVAGTPGIAVGNLQDYISPVKIPVKGKIDIQKNPELPQAILPILSGSIRQYRQLLQVGRAGNSSFIDHAIWLNIKSIGAREKLIIPDSIEYVFINRDFSCSDSFARRVVPLHICVNGAIVVKKKGSHLSGLIALISSHSISVEAGASLDESVLYSDRFIYIQSGAKVSGQFIAPSITLESAVVATYPSTLISLSSQDSLDQTITLQNESRVEGFVAMLTRDQDPSRKHHINICSNATVIGSIYSTADITLDGTVFGSVVTKDFSFYTTPTTYLGWLRSARIDRTKLPQGFLLPPGITSELQLDVLDWL